MNDPLKLYEVFVLGVPLLLGAGEIVGRRGSLELETRILVHGFTLYRLALLVAITMGFMFSFYALAFGPTEKLPAFIFACGCVIVGHFVIQIALAIPYAKLARPKKRHGAAYAADESDNSAG